MADFTRDPDSTLPVADLLDVLERAAGPEAVTTADASGLAVRLMGDAIAANLLLAGFAYQRGLIPVSAEAVERAIEINGVAVDFNKQAFLWGRRAAHDRRAVERHLEPTATTETLPRTLDELIVRRTADLTAYQDAAYARRYGDLVARVRAAEAARAPGRDSLATAVARSWYRLLAVKDEYEVARLYTDGSFQRELAQQFEGPVRLSFHLAPPLIAERDPVTGHLRKRAFGAWMLPAFRLLARLKALRGTSLDPFGRSEERRLERRLIADYERSVETLIAGLTADNHAVAVAIAALPETIRGFGHIKAENVDRAAAKQAELMEAFRTSAPAAAAE